MNIKKILAYIGLFFAFSLICMGIVKADTIEKRVFYNENQLTKLENYKTLFDNAIEYLQLNASTIDSLDSSHHINLTDDESVVGFDLTYSNSLTSPLSVYIYYSTNSYDLTFTTGNSPYYKIGNVYYYLIYLNFDSNYNITGYVNQGNRYRDISIQNGNNSFYNNFYIDYRLGKNTTSNITNNTRNNATLVLGPDGNTYNFTYQDNITLYDFAKYVYGYVEPSQPKCSPSNFLGKFSNVSSFDVIVKSKTNVLNGVVDGAFDIISSSYMTENDWNITYTSNDDDIIHAGSLSCITNRCVFRYQAGVEDDIDTDIILNYHFEPVSGVAMPTTIQIDSCYDSDFYINTTYNYVNDDSSSSGNVSIPSTDNFLQDGTLPNVSGLSDTSIIPDGPVDSILLLPLNVMQSLLNVLNSSTCRPVIIPIPFINDNLSLPCISTIYATIGSIQPMFTSFLNWFSAIVSAFILYQYFIYLYKWVDDTLTFRENNHFGGY